MVEQPQSPPTESSVKERPEPARSRRIARNLGWATLGQISTWLLSLALVLYLPRRFGAAAVGRLYFAQALWAVVGAFAAFGTDQLVTKQVANGELGGKRAAWRSARLRLLLLLVSWPLVYVCLMAFGYDADTIRVCLAIGLAASLTVVGASWRSALVGAEELGKVNVVDVLTKVLLLVIVVLVGAQTESMATVAFAWVLPAALGAVLFGALTKPKIAEAAGDKAAVVEGAEVSNGGLVETLNLGRPFLLLGGAVLLYHQVDIIVISKLADDQAVGWYGAADQLYTSSFFVTTILFGVFGPIMFRLDVRNSDVDRQAINDGGAIIMAVAVPAGLGLASIGDELTTLIFGDDFAPAGAVLQVLGLALIPAYVATFLGYVALTCGLAVAWARMMLAATAVTVALDIVLVRYASVHYDNGALGGSWSYVLTEVAIVLVGLRLIREIFDAAQFGVVALRQLGAGAVMFATLELVRVGPLPARIVMAAAVYGASLMVFGGLNHRQRSLIAAVAPRHGSASNSFQENEVHNADQ